MGMTTLDDVQGWCITHDGVLDVPLPKGMKTVKIVVERGVSPEQVKVAVESVKDIRELLPVEIAKIEEPAPLPVEKKAKKKEESDPPSGTK